MERGIFYTMVKGPGTLLRETNVKCLWFKKSHWYRAWWEKKKKKAMIRGLTTTQMLQHLISSLTKQEGALSRGSPSPTAPSFQSFHVISSHFRPCFIGKLLFKSWMANAEDLKRKRKSRGRSWRSWETPIGRWDQENMNPAGVAMAKKLLPSGNSY